MDIFDCIRSMCLVCTLSWFCVLLFLLHIWMLTKKVSTHLNISCKHSNIMKKLWLNWESYIALLTLLRKALHFILSIIHSFFSFSFSTYAFSSSAPALGLNASAPLADDNMTLLVSDRRPQRVTLASLSWIFIIPIGENNLYLSLFGCFDLHMVWYEQIWTKDWAK